jgi:hypothetical protein
LTNKRSIYIRARLAASLGRSRAEFYLLFSLKVKTYSSLATFVYSFSALTQLEPEKLRFVRLQLNINLAFVYILNIVRWQAVAARGKSLQSQWCAFYVFHLPLFLFISGFHYTSANAESMFFCIMMMFMMISTFRTIAKVLTLSCWFISCSQVLTWSIDSDISTLNLDVIRYSTSWSSSSPFRFIHQLELFQYAKTSSILHLWMWWFLMNLIPIHNSFSRVLFFSQHSAQFIHRPSKLKSYV